MIRKTLVSLLVASWFTLPAVAEVHVDLFGGYSYVRTETEQNLHGWAAEVAFSLASQVDFFVNAGGQYDSFQYAGSDIDVDLHELMLGIRLGARRESKVRGFVHAMAGLVRGGAGTSVLGYSIGASKTVFGCAAGFGAEVRLREHLALRVAQVEYLGTWSEGARGDNFRLASGLTYRF